MLFCYSCLLQHLEAISPFHLSALRPGLALSMKQKTREAFASISAGNITSAAEVATARDPVHTQQETSDYQNADVASSLPQQNTQAGTVTTELQAGESFFQRHHTYKLSRSNPLHA